MELLKSLHINRLREFFKSSETFTSSDLSRFYSSIDPKMSKATLNWRIHSLVHNGYIKRLGRGIFSWGTATEFAPEISDTLMKANSILSKELPFAKACLWNTSLFNQWMQHQPSQFYNVIEVEKDAIDSAFNALREIYPNTFLKPDKNVLELYVLNKPDVLLIIPLISEAPIQELQLSQRKKITTVTLEKLMVDIFCEQDLFAAQQGKEMITIYNNLLSSFTISVNKMLRYAGRRRKKETLIKYLNQKTNFRHIYEKVPFDSI